MSKNILFSYEEVSFRLKKAKIHKSWISDTVKTESKKEGEISYIFCSDDYLLKLNQEYLNHDTYTDIITFDYSELPIISGDIFISIDRIKENAIKFETTFENELSRVIIHGVLHLIGYKDKSLKQKEQMRSKENFYLTLLSEKG